MFELEANRLILKTAGNKAKVKEPKVTISQTEGSQSECTIER